MGCRAAVFVVWVLALMVGACSNDDTTGTPTTTQASATTTESAGTTDTISTIATGTLAPSTTPPGSAGTSATTSTSAPAPAVHSLVLRHDGLGVVSFGQQVDIVVEILTEVLGPPDLEQIQISPDVDRDVQWDEPFLYLQFTSRIGDAVPQDASGGPIFHYYLTTSDRFATTTGIAVGATVADLETAYSDVVFHRTCGGPTQEFLVDPLGGWPQLPIFGLLDGDSDNPATRIAHIGAGWDRSPC